MQTLADTTPQNLPTILEPLVNAYGDWINEQETYLHSGKDIQLVNEYHNVAERAIASCLQTLNRIIVLGAAQKLKQENIFMSILWIKDKDVL